jgi:hypothetical protein
MRSRLPDVDYGRTSCFALVAAGQPRHIRTRIRAVVARKLVGVKQMSGPQRFAGETALA